MDESQEDHSCDEGGNAGKCTKPKGLFKEVLILEVDLLWLWPFLLADDRVPFAETDLQFRRRTIQYHVPWLE
jgi:hypothetical protein